MFDQEKYKERALKILLPIKPATNETLARKDFLFTAQNSSASKNLVEYYLIYFLFSDLLYFKNLGRFEKIAWSFPIDYKGKAYLIEYRKFGVGVFVQDKKKDEQDAVEIVKRINSAIKSARPFYDFLAEEAVNKSQFNVVNNSNNLYERFYFLLTLYKKEYKKYIKSEEEIKTDSIKSVFKGLKLHKLINNQYHQRANWIAISCIESFFSWTEHLFIHLAIVGQNLSDGKAISHLIDAEWKVKYKAAIPYSTKEAEKFFNELLIVRQQLRNFVAHGAFGKNGNAFKFHSDTGAVPVLMDHNKQKNRFSLNGYLTFNEEDVIKLIEEFVKYLHNGLLKPSMYYIQECRLPTILTYAADGSYKSATTDMKSMRKFTKHLFRQFDDSANMDW